MANMVIARVATAVPMGAQRYEQEIIKRAPLALSTSRDWRIRELVVRSLRSNLPGDRRVPHRWLTTSSPAVRAAAGRLLYPRHDVCHRMSLDLPPSTHHDVVTVHDMVAWRFPDEAPAVPSAAYELRRAAAVITVSNFSADDAVEVLGIPRPEVVPNGVDPRFFDATPTPEPALVELGIRSPYVLCAGGATLRKNLAALASAWPTIFQSRPDLSLVLTGPPDPRRSRLFSPLTGTVLTGRLPEYLMPGLVAAARCLVVPSIYEGFGLPALEGMAARTPVVAARASSLPEVVADGGVLVEPDAAGLADGILHAVGGGPDVASTVIKGRRRAADFTWERSARAHAQVWQRAALGH